MISAAVIAALMTAIVVATALRAAVAVVSAAILTASAAGIAAKAAIVVAVTLTAIAWFTADLPAAIRAAGSALPHSTAAGRILRVYEAVFGRLHLRVARRGVACRRIVACRGITL